MILISEFRIFVHRAKKHEFENRRNLLGLKYLIRFKKEKDWRIDKFLYNRMSS